MRCLTAAVVQDVGVVASGVLKGISEDWEPVEGAVGVDTFGKGNHGRSEPRRIFGDTAERVSKDIMDQNRQLT